jgi:3-hydroxyisobutyrate dehydrogenase-like beta-hydroxyacid dehydrogenase
MSTAVGFIGLGSMGAFMARRLLAQEGNVAVYDVRADAAEALAGEGALACASPAEVADHAEVVLVSLPSPDILKEVVGGPNGVLKGSKMRVFVDFSTTGPVVAREVGALLAAAGVSFVDSPVSGGPSGAESGTLTLMVAAPDALIEETRPLLGAIGTTITQVGTEAGQGQLAKVINNLLGAASLAVVGEALALGVKGGLDVGTLLDVINASSGRSGVTQGLYPNQIVNRAFNLGFRLRLEAKDVALCLDEANRQKIPMLVSSAVQQFWSIANTQASDEDDFTAAAKLIETWAGVTLEQKG